MQISNRMYRETKSFSHTTALETKIVKLKTIFGVEMLAVDAG